VSVKVLTETGDRTSTISPKLSLHANDLDQRFNYVVTSHTLKVPE